MLQYFVVLSALSPLNPTGKNVTFPDPMDLIDVIRYLDKLNTLDSMFLLGLQIYSVQPPKREGDWDANSFLETYNADV